jgi:hypothetical protein
MSRALSEFTDPLPSLTECSVNSFSYTERLKITDLSDGSSVTLHGASGGIFLVIIQPESSQFPTEPLSLSMKRSMRTLDN